MALVPCSACRKRVIGKLTSIYIARFSNQERVAKRTRLCRECCTEYADTVKAAKPLVGDDGGSGEWPELCSLCGTKAADELDPIYLTIFEPKQEARQLTIPTCSTCSSNLWPQLTVGASQLADRSPSGNGQPSTLGTGEGAPSPLAWA